MHNAEASRQPIQQLPLSTQSKIRSTQILTSLPQIISELTQNSLDAGACHIDVGVDCEDWACWVRDDGAGIGREGFDALAGEGVVRYSTSKAYSPASLEELSTFGFRGEALASAADVCCLEISSRTARSRESWSVILKDGATLYHGPSLRWRRESPGTVVSIRDAFYNLPIRRRAHPSPSRTLELIRRDIETFALMFPHVSFSVENTHKTRTSTGLGKVMVVPKTGSTLAAFRHLYGRALVEHAEEISEQSGNLRLQGFISLDGSPSKTYQYLYINRHLMSPCDLHRVIEARFSRSSFAKHAYDEEGETSQPRDGTRRSPRKSEKKPVYVLDLTVPPRHVDNCLEPAKAAVQLQNLEVVSGFLSSVIEGFLVRHGFAHSKTSKLRRQEERDSHISSPRKKRKTVCCSDGGRGLSNPAGSLNTVRPGGNASHHAPPVIQPPSDRMVDDTGTSRELETTWTDPITGETFVVDTRTGNSYPLNARPADHCEERRQGRRTLQAGRDSRGRTSYGTKESMPDWIQDALATNETYALPEPRIPALSLSSAFAANIQDWRSCSQPRHPLWRGTRRRVGDAFSQGTNFYASQSQINRFDKDDLSSAQVLGQVDRKFIACVLYTGGDLGDRGDSPREGDTSKVLVLIDQHAADERIRVERFLQELCLGFLQYQAPAGVDDQGSPRTGVRTRALVPPVPVLLAHHEAQRLHSREILDAFRRWGLSFRPFDERCSQRAPDGHEGQNDGSGSGYVQVFVDNVPELLGDKLLSGDELRDLVKGYLARLETEGPPVLAPSQHDHGGDTGSSQNDDGWQKAMRWCPRELLELINSMACRGAIMFNDSLAYDQCVGLVRRLAETAFPFQCAHGRPSLVPLTNLGTDSGKSESVGGIRSCSRSHTVDWKAYKSAR